MRVLERLRCVVVAGAVLVGCSPSASERADSVVREGSVRTEAPDEGPLPATRTPPPGPWVVSYGCGFGLADGTYSGWDVTVDLDARTAVQTRIERSFEEALPDPAAPDPAHSRRTTIASVDAARLTSLTAAALTRERWPLESAEMDGIACMLGVHRPGGEALLRVQRQTTDGGDAPAALIEGLGSLVSLGPPAPLED